MAMRKTTVMIDEELLREAMAAVGARSKREAIEAGLRNLVRRHHIEALRRELGTFDIELTLGDLEESRNAD
jgi:Arc/MetJ family transcription regulator